MATQKRWRGQEVQGRESGARWAGLQLPIEEDAVIWVPVLVAGVVVVTAAKELAKALDARRPKPVPVKVPAK